MRRFVFDIQRFGEEVTLNKSSFLIELNNLIATTNAFFDKKLKAEVKSEAEAKLADYPNSDKSWETFKREVSTPGDINEKNKIPKKVWQAIMQGAIAKNNAIKDIPSLSGLNLDEDANNIISSVGGYLYSFLKNEPVTVKDGDDTYTVSVTAYSTATVTIKNKTYNINWASSNSAKTALNSYLGELKTYFDDVFNNLGAKYDGIAESIYAVIKECMQKATGKAVNDIFSIFKKDSTPIKTIKALDKNYSDFLKKANDLKGYVTNTGKYDKTAAKKYNALIAAYNKLGLDNTIDGLVDKYLNYKFSNVTNGEFNQQNASISGTSGADSIRANGSNVIVIGGDGNDTISAYGSNGIVNGDGGDDCIYSSASKNTVSGGKGNDTIIIGDNVYRNNVDSGAGDDKIGVDGNQNTVSGGADNDCIIISGDENTITGGLGNDTIFLLGASESVIKYKSGDGNDLIVGYEESTTLKIADGYSTQTSGQDVIISVGNSSINLVGASGKQININKTNKVVGKFTSGETKTYILPSFYGIANYVKYGTNGDDKYWGYYSSFNYTDNVFINMLAGNDKIYNYGSDMTIDGGAGDDYIENGAGGSLSAINGGTGNDTIYNSANGVTIDGGNGNDSITNRGDNASLFGGKGDDTISNGGDFVIIDGGAGNDNISNSSKDVSINSGAGNDYIYSGNNNITVDSGTGNDTIDSSSDNSLIQSGAGNDSIVNRGDNSTVDAGAGNDLVRNVSQHSSKVSILGGMGNDSIYNDNFAYNGYYYYGGSDVTIDGGAGNDIIKINKNSSRNNLIEYKSGEGNDTIIGFNETSTLSIAGGGYVTTSGDDVIIKSGGGSVRLSDARLNETLNIIFSDGSDTNGILSVEGSAKSDSIINKRNNSTINALGGDDSIFNYASSVLIFGGKNNDTISNDGEKVLIFGGTENDSICNFGKYATINGDAGKDFIYNDGKNVTMLGGAGNDSIDNYGDSVKIDGGAGNDSIKIFGNNITVDGGVDNDYISTATKIVRKNGKYETITSNNVIMNGGSGNDTIYNKYGSNITVEGGKGNDLISLGSGSKNEVIKYKFGDGNDLIVGLKENSTISISGGTYSQHTFFNDVILTVGKGKITLQGAAKLGTLNIRGKEDPNSPGRNFIFGTAGNDSIYNTIEGATIQALGGNDTVKNGDGYYVNMSGKSKISINAGNGNDKIYNYGAGTDSTIFCGSGNDYVWNAGANVLIDGGNGNNTITSFYGGNSTIYGGKGNDSIDIGGSKNVVYGGDGNDTIDGSSNALIDAGKGNDSIYSYSNSTIYAGSGNDTIHSYHSDNSTISAGAGNDSILIDNGGAYDIIDAGSGNDYIQNGSKLAAGNYLKIIGGSGNDTIKNNGASVTIEGGKGDDVISLGSWKKDETVKYTAGDGNDTIYNFDRDRTLSIAGTKYSTKKSGSDVVVTVGKGKITLVGAASLNKVNIDFNKLLTVNDKKSSPVTVASDIKIIDASTRTKAVKITGNSKANTISGGSKNDTLYGAAGDDSLFGGAGNDYLSGGDGEDTLWGGKGNDKLYGGKGNDTLWGGAGNDTLWGDDGADKFIYRNGDGNDVIVGFDKNDMLTLDSLDFTSYYSQKTESVALKFDSGSITLKNFTATTFLINNDAYKISGTKLVKY